MKRIDKIYGISLFCLFLLFQPTFAQEQNKPIPLDPEVTYGRLDNGLTYYIRKNNRPENRVQLRLVVNAGSILEDEDQLGLAHFTEHMLFNGTESFEKNEIVDFLQSVGVEFGADLNAYTSFDETVYMLPLPSDDPEILDQGFQILEEMAHQATFEGEEIDKERGVVLEEWRRGLGASERLRKQYLPLVLKGSRYKDRLPIGDTTVLKNFEYDVIKRFYRDWYRPDLMAVVVVGDIDVAEIKSNIENRFADLEMPENPRDRKTYELPGHDETLVAVATDKEQPFTQIEILYKLPEKNIETASDYRSLLTRSLYNSMLNSRLDELTQQANPPFIQAFSAYGGYLGDKDAYRSIALVNEQNAELGLRTLIRENQRVLQHGFLKSELERAKKNLLNSYERAYNERNKTESSNYVNEYINHYLENEPSPGIEWEYEYVQEQLPTISIDEINALPSEWIIDSNRVVLVLGPEKAGIDLPDEEKIRSILEETETIEVEPYVDNVVDEPLIAEMPEPGTITAEKQLDAVDATEITLSNGLKVVLKPTDFKDDEILMTAHSFGGHSLVSDEDYQSALNANSVIQESGIRKFSATDLEKLLAGQTVSVSSFIGETSEGMRGSAAPKDLETLFQLTYLYFTQPRKDETSFESYINKNKSILQNILSNPGFYFQDQVAKVLTQNNPRGGGIPKPEDLDQVELDRAIDIYQDRFADASDFIFFFVGNFDVEEIKPLLTQYLGGLPDINREESFRDLGIRPPKGGVNKTFQKGTEPQSQVRLVFTGELQEDKHRFLLDAMAEALTIKLIENLREEMSGVYGTSANARSSKFPYLSYSVNISFTCAPENVDTLIQAAEAEIRKIQENGPTEEDLTKVKEQKIKDLEENIKKNGYWLSALRTVYVENKDISRITEASQKARIESLTQEDLQEMANMYMNFEDLIVLKLLPEEVEEVETTEAPNDITVDAITDLYIETIGGADKLNEVSSYRSQGKMSVMGMEMEIYEARKAPDKYVSIQSTPMGEMKQIYNAGKMVMVTPQGTQELPPEASAEMKYEAEAMFFELEYADLGIVGELQGIEKVEERDAYKVVYTYPSGRTSTRWYDMENGLLVKVENEEQVIHYKSYQEVNGIQFPKEVQVRIKSQGMDANMTIENIEVNPELEDSLFETN